MPFKSKFQLVMEEAAAKIPPEELQAVQACPQIKSLLDTLNTSPKKVTNVSTCDETAVVRILGLDTSRVQKITHQWDLPEDVLKIKPSKWLQTSFSLIDEYWRRNSENSTRTLIDLCLLEALHQVNKGRGPDVKPISSWTEISLSWSTETEELSGRGDYFLGYSQGDKVDNALHTLLLAGEAKALDSERNIWQIIAYCGILHKIRKRRAAVNPDAPVSTIYGFLTDSAAWQFVRVDNDGVVVTSKLVSEYGEVVTWLGYLIRLSQSSTPSASPAISLEDLRDFSVKIERFNLRNQRTYDLISDDEDDDDVAAEAFRSMYQKNLAEATKKIRKE